MEVQELNGFIPYYQLLAALLIGFTSIDSLKYFLKKTLIKVIFDPTKFDENALHAYAIEQEKSFFNYYSYIKKTLIAEIQSQLVNSAIMCICILLLVGYQTFYIKGIFNYHFTVISGFSFAIFLLQSFLCVKKCFNYRAGDQSDDVDDFEPIIRKRYIWGTWIIILLLLFLHTFIPIYYFQRSFEHCIALSLFMTVAPFIFFIITSLSFGFILRHKVKSFNADIENYIKIQNSIQQLGSDPNR